MIKEFFEEYSHLKLGLQHLQLYGGCWVVQIYNTTFDDGFEPIFKHIITDEEINNLNVDFETVIMTPVINWLKDCEKKRKRKEFKYKHGFDFYECSHYSCINNVDCVCYRKDRVNCNVYLKEGKKND